MRMARPLLIRKFDFWRPGVMVRQGLLVELPQYDDLVGGRLLGSRRSLHRGPRDEPKVTRCGQYTAWPGRGQGWWNVAAGNSRISVHVDMVSLVCNYGGVQKRNTFRCREATFACSVIETTYDLGYLFGQVP